MSVPLCSVLYLHRCSTLSFQNHSFPKRILSIINLVHRETIRPINYYSLAVPEQRILISFLFTKYKRTNVDGSFFSKKKLKCITFIYITLYACCTPPSLPPKRWHLIVYKYIPVTELPRSFFVRTGVLSTYFLITDAPHFVQNSWGNTRNTTS